MTRNVLVACNMLLAVVQAPTARGTLRLYAVGDINLGRRTARERLIAGDTVYSFRLLLDTLRGADITFGNLESPIAADSGQVDDSGRSEEHTSELQSPCNLVCRLLLEKKKMIY